MTANETEYSIAGLSFPAIYGERSGCGFVAFPSWGVAAELSEHDTAYNTRKIFEALQRSTGRAWLPESDEAVKTIARELAELLTQDIQEL